MGGAVSVDPVAEAARAGGRDAGRWWWPDEEPTQADVDALGDTPLDVLVTHDVPAGVDLTSILPVAPATLARANATRGLLRQAVERTRPEVVLAGHWHRRVTATVARADSGTTRVEVLSEEHTAGNAVVLDLSTLAVEPLQDVWRRERGA